MDADRLPEVFDFEGLTVRYFPAERATEQLSQSERRSIPAIIRRLFSTASRYAVEETNCLICEAPAPITGQSPDRRRDGRKTGYRLRLRRVCWPERAHCPSSLKFC